VDRDLKNKDLSKIQSIDLTVDQTSNTIPANVVSAKTGTVNRQLGIRDTGSFGVNVNIHVNVVTNSDHILVCNLYISAKQLCQSHVISPSDLGKRITTLYR